jgi:hypothetical protein
VSRSRPRPGRRKPPPPPDKTTHGLAILETLSTLEDHSLALRLAVQWASDPRGGAGLDPEDRPAVQQFAQACTRLADRQEQHGFRQLAATLEDSADQLRTATAHLRGDQPTPSPLRLRPLIAVRCAAGLDDVAQALVGWWQAVRDVYEPEDSTPADAAPATAAADFARAAHRTHRAVAASLGVALTGGGPHAA